MDDFADYTIRDTILLSTVVNLMSKIIDSDGEFQLQSTEETIELAESRLKKLSTKIDKIQVVALKQATIKSISNIQSYVSDVLKFLESADITDPNFTKKIKLILKLQKTFEAFSTSN